MKELSGDDQANRSVEFIILNGIRRNLLRHPTDFSILVDLGVAKRLFSAELDVHIYDLSHGISRVRVKDTSQRDALMQRVGNSVDAQPIYKTVDTDEEIIITDELFLTLYEDDPDKLKAIQLYYGLENQERRGKAFGFKVASNSKGNSLEVANKIAGRPNVESCIPKILLPITLTSSLPQPTIIADSLSLFPTLPEQWYLTTQFVDSRVELEPKGSLVKPNASIDALGAWKYLSNYGDPDTVIAIIDEGFRLDHPAFTHTRISVHITDLAAKHPEEDSGYVHGTAIASIVTASKYMMGVAPECTLLPWGIPLKPYVDADFIINILEEVSLFADVVNCSFSMKPTSFNFLENHPDFLARVQELIQSGGQRRRGLNIVIAAGNDDAPLSLRASENRNGISFLRNTGAEIELFEIPAGFDVHTGFSEISGMVVVAALSSLKRKSGYSNWGEQLTVAAPSDNKTPFGQRLPGLEILAATSDTFGGTSAAAAMVTGTIALMLSANPQLTTQQVSKILKETADRDLDPYLDWRDDPNLKGFSGEFVNGHSLFFGAGKVNAAHAVRQALEMLPLFEMPSLSEVGTVDTSTTIQLTDKKLYPIVISSEVSPFVSAVAELQTVINQMKGRPSADVSVRRISHNTPISINFDGAKEAIKELKDDIIPWRRKHAKKIARFQEQEKQIEIASKKAELLERQAKGIAETDKLAAEAAIQRETAERMRIENERLRLELHKEQIQLVLEIIDRVAPQLSEQERIANLIKLLPPINTLVFSELLSGSENDLE